MRRAALLPLLLACHDPPAVPAPPASEIASPVLASASPPAGDAGLAAAGTAEIAVLMPGRFEISAPIALETVARLEQRGEGGSWTALRDLDLGAGYRLFEACPTEASPPACTLAKQLQPPRWTGLGCSGQCNHSCRSNRWHGPGTFRLVVQECDGSIETVGPPFEMPSSDFADDGDFERWGLATQLESGTAVRLEPPDATWDAVVLAKGKLAGFTERAGSEHALDPSDLQAIAGLLRNPKGFDDELQKRCKMTTGFGLRLVRSIPTTGWKRDEPLEIGLDLACAKLFAVRGEGAHRIVHATHFDGSKPAFVALAKRLFPGDRELAKVR